MVKIFKNKTFLFQLFALAAFAGIAMSSSGDDAKAFNDGYRRGYDAVSNAYSENAVPSDSLDAVQTRDIASFLPQE